KLSGGEKRRLYLLRVLMSEPNVLILDEPTNDLDIRTMTILEDYLDHFDGIVITVSHDRYFLDRVVNRIFSFEGNGHIAQYEGGYTDYQVEYLRRHPEQETGFAKAGSVAGVGMDAGTAGKITVGSAGKVDSSPSGTGEEESNSTSNRERHQLRMSYKEKKEWETIEQDIDALETRISAIDEEMLQYAKDFVKLHELTKEKEEKEAALDAKMERWAYLSDLQEKIDKG
ncbi:MAG TPA: ABC transporter ATP-binding protein, partial [Oribacterium sp.]|nr:ABC transporter ATP-binding protein [Oribacterium sp.]